MKDWGSKFSEIKGFEVKAESYMDTVSQIRGNMGRPPLDESQRIYFMKKAVDTTDVPASQKTKNFSFMLEVTEEGEKLLDAYVGVDFSVVYKITCKCIDKTGKPAQVDAQFYVAVPGSGI